MRLLGLAFVVPAVLWVSAATADYYITKDQGGPIDEYKARFASVRDRGERVVIDGVCDSACTLILGIVPIDRICVTRRASLGFHMVYFDLAATDGVKIVSYVATAEIVRAYPNSVKKWLDDHGGLTRDAKYIIDGPELWAIVKPCPKNMR